MKNWKTTLAGIIAAALQLLSVPGPISWRTVVGAAGAVLIGLTAKDADVTGGTRQQ